MIKNIIFDFGDIFINLDKQALYTYIATHGLTAITLEMDTITKEYEKGFITSQKFIDELHQMLPEATRASLIATWNAIILDFPEYRLTFLEQLKADNQYRLFLLSNTNELHITEVEKSMGTKRYQRFKACFEQFYLSHEINMRKPDTDIYEFVLSENSLKAKETFFIDDTKENTDSAVHLGILCWNLQVGTEDVIHLKDKL